MSLDRWAAAEWKIETLVSIVPPVLPDGLCAMKQGVFDGAASCLGNQRTCLLILRLTRLAPLAQHRVTPVLIPIGK